MTKTLLSIAAITALLTFSGCSAYQDNTGIAKEDASNKATETMDSAKSSTSDAVDNAKESATDAANTSTDKAESMTDKAVEVADEHTDGSATKVMDAIK